MYEQEAFRPGTDTLSRELACVREQVKQISTVLRGKQHFARKRRQLNRLALSAGQEEREKQKRQAGSGSN